MKLKKIMAAMVACLVTWVSLGTVHAITKTDAVSPLYLYTQTVIATLEISGGGYATCCGKIKTRELESEISITVTL